MLRVYTYMPPEGRDADRAELPGRALAGQGERRDHPGRGVRRGLDRPRLALGHAHLPDRLRGRAARARQLDDRRHRRRPGRRLELHRRAREVRGRPGDEVRRARRRDRRRRGGEGGARTSPSTCRSRSSRTSPASRRRPARRWATPARSSPARPAPPRRRRTRSRRSAIKVGTTPTEVAELVVAAASELRGRERGVTPGQSRVGHARVSARKSTCASKRRRTVEPVGGRLRRRCGSVSRKRAPRGELSTVASPPCARAASRTIARPRPAPGFERAPPSGRSGRRSAATSSSAIPGPWSATTTSPSRTVTSIGAPAGLYLTALSSRFEHGALEQHRIGPHGGR